MDVPGRASVELYWLPLGAGGHSVRLNGKLFEAFAAWRGRRARCDLYHGALEVVCDRRFVIEQAPAQGEGATRGVVATGPVGTRSAGRLRLFRYEIRRWPGGTIPDRDEAVGGAHLLSTDPATARRLLELVPDVPVPTCGGRASVGHLRARLLHREAPSRRSRGLRTHAAVRGVVAEC